MTGGPFVQTKVNPKQTVKVQKPREPGPGEAGFDPGPVKDFREVKEAYERLRKEARRRNAQNRLDREWIKLGGPSHIGVLGNPLEGVQELENGGFSRRHEYGALQLLSMPRRMKEEFYVADIEVAAIKCFGTEDPGSDDEPYLLITAVAPAGAFMDAYRAGVVRTWRSERYEDISEGEVFGTDLPVFQNILFGPDGISLKLLLMEHEHGDEEELRRKIEEKGNKLAREIIDAAALLAGLDIDDETRDQVLDNEILKTLGDVSAGVLTDLLKDDRIDEKTWKIHGDILKTWADDPQAFERSDVAYPPGALPEFVKTNFPREGIHDEALLFSGGGGSYKVYLRVTPKKVVIV
jgi:hypothetical protein